MSAEPPVPDRASVRRFLRALYRCAPPSAWVEVRFRLGRGMGQAFHPMSFLDGAVDSVLARSVATDVFVGVVARSRRGGGRSDLLGRSAVVWVDCDGADSVAALGEFRPRPSMVVASGSGENLHAYWLLEAAIGIESMESINRRLAFALSADVRSADGARILRPPGSLNWKRCPPAFVRLLRLQPRSRILLRELEVMLPPGRTDLNLSSEKHSTRMEGPDSLLAISPREYVARLTGQPVGRSGKIGCPFHDDQTPSLHAYEDPERGWYCFGCGRGGSVYDLAALLWGRATRGEDFVRLRRDLAQHLR